jgi:GntP family gluconate:H+ symporter
MLITHETGLLLIGAAAVATLIVLVSWCKFPPFVALILASLGVGLCAGQNPSAIIASFSQGVGSVLGSVAMILALGAVLGQGLAVSGGAQRIGEALITAFPKNWIPCALACAAFLVGIPVFFNAGLVLLVPVVIAAANQRGLPLARLGLPMVTGLSVAHGLVPPHPGPLSAIGILHADVGKTIVYSLIVGFPTALILGAFLAPGLTRGEPSMPIAGSLPGNRADFNPPQGNLGIALVTILAPVFLMLLGMFADFFFPKSSILRLGADWLGNPIVAMLLGALFSLAVLVWGQGFNKGQIAMLTEECLTPLASTMLVVGAGGGFSKVLLDGGVGIALAKQAIASNISPLVLAWLVAAFIRVATGSATVSITTGAGLMAPVIAANPSLNRELVVLAMGAGSLVLSHVNDGGFWLVKQYLQLSVTETLKTWTVLETAISILAFAFVLLLNFLI